MSDLISRADAIEAVRSYFKDRLGKSKCDYDEELQVYVLGKEERTMLTYNKGINDKLRSLPSAEAETMCVARIEVDTEEVVRRIKEENDKTNGWIPLSHDDDGLGTDFPCECDGKWVIVTDGNTISVERIKKDAYDHFFPAGRWFELEDVIAWMPLPKPYREDGE